MKRLGFVFTVLIAVLTVTSAVAGGPESGFYFGGGGNAQWVSGNGTWGTYDFDISQPLSSDSGAALGFAWTDKVLLGVKPIIGYKLNSSLALQVGYSLNITKPSRQSVSSTNGLVFYEQGISYEWKQNNLEILGLFYPNSDLEYYFFGGVELVEVNTDITLYENVEYEDGFGGVIGNGDFQVQSDKIRATGFVLGAGVEFTSDNNQRAAYVSIQYSRSVTDDTFFGSEAFKVDLGGISFNGGIKWYLF